MLTRAHIRGFKSLEDTEVRLAPLTVLFGPNAAGKSNLLDALRLLSRLATSGSVGEAFDPPRRGTPIEVFTVGRGGIEALAARARLAFSIEADLRLSEAVVAEVDRRIGAMHGADDDAPPAAGQALARVRERNLRYRVRIEMLPGAGVLRVADEYLVALNDEGEPAIARKPFVERQGERLHLRREGQANPVYYDCPLDHTVLSLPHHPPHYPHLVAARRELESWRFFRSSWRTGLADESLAAFLQALAARDPARFAAVEESLRAALPDFEGIDLAASDPGRVELRLREGGAFLPARVLSGGTLRLLGLLAQTGDGAAPALAGFEEPENGVHPRRLPLVADRLKTRAGAGETQHIVTTHSPALLDLLPEKSLFAVRQSGRRTRIDPVSAWPPPGGDAPVSARIMRGDFDA